MLIWKPLRSSKNLWIHLKFLFSSAVVDGNWGAWGAFGPCTKTCGSGSALRKRTCDDPPPSNGGKSCEGHYSSWNRCTNTQPCASKNEIKQFKFKTLTLEASVRNFNGLDSIILYAHYHCSFSITWILYSTSAVHSHGGVGGSGSSISYK